MPTLSMAIWRVSADPWTSAMGAGAWGAFMVQFPLACRAVMARTMPSCRGRVRREVGLCSPWSMKRSGRPKRKPGGNPRSLRTRATSDPAPPIAAFSSMLTSRMVPASSAIRSASRGLTKRILTTVASIFAGGERGGNQAAEGEQGNGLSPPANFRLADRRVSKLRSGRRSGPSAPRVTHRAGAFVGKGGRQHAAAFRFVGGRHDDHIGDARQAGESKVPWWWAVGADQPAAVDGEDHWQVLQRHVVDELVVARCRKVE